MAQVKHPSIVDVVDELISHGVDRELLQLNTNKIISGRKLIIKGKEVIHFGNCNYLGLERHPAVKKASIAAIEEEGIRLTMSRSYVSSGYYVELEELLSEMYGGSVVVAPSSTMLHLSAIPVLFGRNDLCLLDQQVHASMVQAVQVAKVNGLKTKTVRHNRFDLLEDFILKYKNEYEKVWYVLDGIYSMYGDAPDIEALVALLDKYPNFYLYVDDAHGCSWKGKHGKGYILDKVDLHEKMMMTVSLGKGFGVIGGVLVTKNPIHCRRVRNCGNTMIFSAPLSSGLLGAAIASAKIHLTDELTVLQEDLQDKIRYTNYLIKEYNLPSVREEDSPIFYIGVGLIKAAYNLLELLLEDGYLCNIGGFPAVSLKCAGIRFLTTCHLTKADIEGLIKRIAYHLPYVLADADFTFKDLAKSFNLPHFEELGKYHVIKEIQGQDRIIPILSKDINQSYQTTVGSGKEALNVAYYPSITVIKDKEEWNEIFAQQDLFSDELLKFYEATFSDNKEAYNNWNFLYYIIRDDKGKIVTAAFFTESLWKEDILSPASVSKEFEEIRNTENPNYMISKSISLGCQAYIGQPLYLDRTHKNWKKALNLLLRVLWEEEDRRNTEILAFRDMDTDDMELKKFFIDKGFLLTEMPDVNIIKPKGATPKAFHDNLSAASRRHFRKDIIPYVDMFEISKVTSYTEEELDVYYKLYHNVKEVNLGLNTFPLPKKFFSKMIDEQIFEVIKIELKAEHTESGKKELLSFFFGKKVNSFYHGLYLGINYDYLHSHKIYRQTLYQMVQRTLALDCETIILGFSADFEKRKLGATTVGKVLFTQFKDNYKQTVINNMGVQHLKKHY